VTSEGDWRLAVVVVVIVVAVTRVPGCNLIQGICQGNKRSVALISALSNVVQRSDIVCDLDDIIFRALPVWYWTAFQQTTFLLARAVPSSMS